MRCAKRFPANGWSSFLSARRSSSENGTPWFSTTHRSSTGSSPLVLIPIVEGILVFACIVRDMVNLLTFSSDVGKKYLTNFLPLVNQRVSCPRIHWLYGSEKKDIMKSKEVIGVKLERELDELFTEIVADLKIRKSELAERSIRLGLGAAVGEIIAERKQGVQRVSKKSISTRIMEMGSNLAVLRGTSCATLLRAFVGSSRLSRT